MGAQPPPILYILGEGVNYLTLRVQFYANECNRPETLTPIPIECNCTLSARSEFLGGGKPCPLGVASRVPWGWRDSYGKTGNFGRVGDKSMFKMYKKAGVGREGDI